MQPAYAEVSGEPEDIVSSASAAQASRDTASATTSAIGTMQSVTTPLTLNSSTPKGSWLTREKEAPSRISIFTGKSKRVAIRSTSSVDTVPFNAVILIFLFHFLFPHFHLIE